MKNKKPFSKSPKSYTGQKASKPFKGRGDKPQSSAKPSRPVGQRPQGGQSAPRPSSGFKVNIWGWHACLHAYANPNRRISKIYLTDASEERFEEELMKIDISGLDRPSPQLVSPHQLDHAIRGDAVHQGIAMQVSSLTEMDVKELLIKSRGADKGLVVILDQVTDPHNIGAIIRSASAFGATGMILQRKHAPELEGVLAKTACGGLEHLPIAHATNLSRAIEELQEDGYTVLGLDERGESKFSDFHKHEKVAIVLGAEGPGMRRLVSEHCDALVALPTQAPIYSLNVSNAAAVALFALKS